MQDLLIETLRPRIAALPFITLAGGLAQTLRTTSTAGQEVRQPISNDPALLASRSLAPGQYVSLAPDGREKGVAYFEHRSLKVTAVDGRFIKLTSVLRLVYWGVLGHDPLNAALAQAAVIKALPGSMYTSAPLSGILHEVTGILLAQDGLFDKYTYDERQLQHLMSPYTAFAVEIQTKFSASLSCLPQVANFNAQ